jgi:hypothetical protein
MASPSKNKEVHRWLRLGQPRWYPPIHRLGGARSDSAPPDVKIINIINCSTWKWPDARCSQRLVPHCPLEDKAPFGLYLYPHIVAWPILQYLRSNPGSIHQSRLSPALEEEDQLHTSQTDSSSHAGPTATTARERSRSHRPFSGFDTDTLNAVRRMSTTKNPLR